MTDWKVGDWAVFERNIVQIKEIRESGSVEVSDGSFSTFGNLFDRLRPLTLRNKRTGEWFEWHYGELRKIRGSGGFNYPDIHRYFSQLALDAMEGTEGDQTPYDSAREFLQQARDYVPLIKGVHLFREAA